jgi:hypothetical protein
VLAHHPGRGADCARLCAGAAGRGGGVGPQPGHQHRPLLALVVAAGALLTGQSGTAVRTRQRLTDGIASLRGGAEQAGLRTGPVGAWVYANKAALHIGAVVLAALAMVFWSQPTGKTVLLVAGLLLVVLALIEFLGRPPDSPPPPRQPSQQPTVAAGHRPIAAHERSSEPGHLQLKLILGTRRPIIVAIELDQGGDSGEAANWFSGMRVNARPARSAGLNRPPSTFRPEWPTKEAHRRAMNRSGGFLTCPRASNSSPLGQPSLDGVVAR